MTSFFKENMFYIFLLFFISQKPAAIKACFNEVAPMKLSVTKPYNVTPGAWNYILREISKPDVDNAFWVMNVQNVLDQWDRWQQHLPNVRPHFAIKSNPLKVLLAILFGLGAGFDCASPVIDI